MLVLLGVVLRIVAEAGWWPAATTLGDSYPYAQYAESDLLHDPAHPGGYSALLWAVGLVSRELAVTILLQHLLGIATALVLYVAVRRVSGSPWPGLVPAAVVLLGLDQIFLEHQIMSEGPFLFILSVGFYVAVRAMDEPFPVWRWPALAGALVALSAVVRPAALFAVPVIVAVLLLVGPRGVGYRARLAPAAAVAVTAAVLLVAYGFATRDAVGRFELGPTTGWHLYSRVAPFADCRQFTPPAGTAGLCESRPFAQRPGGNYYLFDATAPAHKLYGSAPWIANDAKMRDWSTQVILHQPKTYARAMWRDLRTNFIPSSRTVRLGESGDLDPELDWSAVPYRGESNVLAIQQGLRLFYNPFRIHRHSATVGRLHDLQRVLRFGATLLSIATILTLLGLLVGSRRERAAILLFGGGGLALLVVPTLTVWYVGRYTVPLAPLMAAGGALGTRSLWLALRRAKAQSPFHRSSTSGVEGASH